MESSEITNEWLHQHLGWPVPTSDVAVVTTIPGSGLMGRIYQIKCAGNTCVLKCSPATGTVWCNLFLKTGLHDREVQAYKFLGTHCRPSQKVAPECYCSVAISDGSGWLALEDLTQHSVKANHASGLDYAQAKAAMRTLAMLHSLLATTNGDALAPPHSWMYAANSEGLITAIATGLEVLPTIVQERLPRSFKRESLLRIMDINSGRVMADSHMGSRLISFCHGDTWSNNVLFVRDKEPRRLSAVLVDWQFAMWGNPLSDVGLLMLSSISPESRRSWTHKLLQEYHSALIECCEIQYSFEECLADFAKAMSYCGLVAVATLEAYTYGMTPSELESIALRMYGIVDDIPALFQGSA